MATASVTNCIHGHERIVGRPCRGCNKVYKKKQYLKHKESGHRRNYLLKKLYGITLNDYEKMLGDQNGGCAICGTPDPGMGRDWFAVDHCHETGRVRGLLCQKHNLLLGHTGDDPEILRQAALYLERHS